MGDRPLDDHPISAFIGTHIPRFDNPSSPSTAYFLIRVPHGALRLVAL